MHIIATPGINYYGMRKVFILLGDQAKSVNFTSIIHFNYCDELIFILTIIKFIVI